MTSIPEKKFSEQESKELVWIRRGSQWGSQGYMTQMGKQLVYKASGERRGAWAGRASSQEDHALGSTKSPTVNGVAIEQWRSTTGLVVG